MSEEEDKSYWRGQNLLLLRACREKCGRALTGIARTWLSAVGKSNVRLRSVCEELLHAPSLACLRGHVKRSVALLVLLLDSCTTLNQLILVEGEIQEILHLIF